MRWNEGKNKWVSVDFLIYNPATNKLLRLFYIKYYGWGNMLPDLYGFEMKVQNRSNELFFYHR